MLFFHNARTGLFNRLGHSTGAAIVVTKTVTE